MAGTVGTHLPDEWDTHLPGNLTTADALRLVPPTPGSGPRFLTLTNHFYSRANPLPQGKGMYPALAASADVLGFDLYPLQNWCRFDSFGDVFDSQLDLVALGRGRPTFQWIEARRMDCSGDQLDPTAQTVRAESWLSIAGGAHAIGYFPNNWSLDVGAEIARTNHEIQSLAPALVEPPIAASVPPDSLIKVGAREHNGAIYVIAVNASRGSASSTINVPACRGPGSPKPRRTAHGHRQRRLVHRFVRPARGARLHRLAPPGVVRVRLPRKMAEPTREDIDALVGPATPHFAPQLRARVEELVGGLSETHPVRAYAREKIELLERLGFASSKAEEGPREPRSRPGWNEIPSTAPANEPLPGRK